jgi:hypothetical protein
MFNIEFDRRHKLVLVRFRGDFGRNDIENLDDAVARLVSAEGPVHFLLDFSAVETVSVTQGAIAERGKRVQLFPGYHRIIVAPQAEIFGLFCLFGANQSLIRSSVPLVVETMEQALVCLGVPAASFSPYDLIEVSGH